MKYLKTKPIAKDFPVVCVDGSAGGLDDYILLLQNLPIDMGIAVVIVNHMRTLATMLHEISAIASGYIVYILSPEDIARKIIHIAHTDEVEH